MDFTAIKNRVYFLTKTNSTSFPVADLTQGANNAMERVVSLINNSDSRWQFDDTNQTDLPIATTALVSGQQDYTLSTVHLSIDRVEVKNSAGTWLLLTPIDQHDVDFQSLASYLGSGTPTEYDKSGTSVFLYPIPNYSQSASLKVYFTRAPVAFVTSDSSAVPGFNSLFHDLIPLWIAFDYAVANSLPTANGFLTRINVLEGELIKFFGQRSRDERPCMMVSTGSVGSRSGVLNSGGSDSNK